jgi:biotin synthase
VETTSENAKRPRAADGRWVAACGAGARLTRDEALRALSADLPETDRAAMLAAADARARQISGNRGRAYAVIGVDSAPCARNCAFCSHGAKWRVYGKPYQMSVEEVCLRAGETARHRPDWLTLRTTQDYGIEKLCRVARAVREALPADTALVVNTGEFEAGDCERLLDAGVAVVYHTIRLREGRDTGVRPDERARTLERIRDSGLALFALVEPVGPEHTDEELVDAAFRLKDFGVRLSGAMARVPIPGTPLGALGAVTDERLARVVAMTRLISGPEVEAICVHPPLPAALRAGANVVVAEYGAIPRDRGDATDAWRQFDLPAAQVMLAGAGFSVR